MIRNQIIHNGKTEAQILALTGQNITDIFVSSDTSKVYKIGAGGTAELSTDIEIVYVNGTPEIADKAVTVLSETAGIHRLDGRLSENKGVAIGGTVGRHKWTFQGQKNTVDLTSSPTAATILAGANVVEESPGVWKKSIAGNTWNASIYSQESFNPLEQDFAVTLEIEGDDDADGETGIQGTVREMFGFDDNPTQNNSYTSIENAIYQVNSYFYSRIYEKGVSKVMNGYSTFYFQVGDKVGVKCVDGWVTYFVLRAGIETEIYTSEVKAVSPMFFKAAFNRGDGSTGQSRVKNVEFWTATKVSQISRTIEGNSADDLTQEDQEALTEIGMLPEPSSKYSDISYTRSTGIKFDNAGTPYDIEMAHDFASLALQDIQTINF